MTYGRKMIVAALLVVSAGALLMTGCSSSSNASAGSETPLQALQRGATEFLAGNFTNLKDMSSSTVRTGLATNGQHPSTVVLTCSDSRVPPEIIFNKGLGELFVIRVAGNIVGPYELASIEYAVEHTGSTQIVVLGHSHCGAVQAAFNNYTATRSFRSVAGVPGFSNLSSLVTAIRPAVEAAAATNGNSTLWEASVDENVKLVKEQLTAKSPILEEKIHAGQLTIIGAKYDISTGAVDWNH